MSSLLEIRKATLEDIDTIQQLAEDTWWPTYTPILSAEQIRFMLDQMYNPDALQKQMIESQIFLLARRENKDVAFASYSIADGEKTILKIHKLYVLPEEQGKGTGKYLICHLEREAKNLGAEKLELNVNRFNPAMNFYQKAGFSIYQEKDIPYFSYWMNDYILRKNLI